MNCASDQFLSCSGFSLNDYSEIRWSNQGSFRDKPQDSLTGSHHLLKLGNGFVLGRVTNDSLSETGTPVLKCLFDLGDQLSAVQRFGQVIVGPLFNSVHSPV